MPVTSMANSQVKPSMRKAEVEAEGRHPLDADAQDAATVNGRILEGRQDGGAQGHGPGQEGGTVPGILPQEGGNEAPDERKGDDGQEGHATGHGLRWSPSGWGARVKLRNWGDIAQYG